MRIDRAYQILSRKDVQEKIFCFDKEINEALLVAVKNVEKDYKNKVHSEMEELVGGRLEHALYRAGIESVEELDRYVKTHGINALADLKDIGHYSVAIIAERLMERNRRHRHDPAD